jgi:hypothetical protein
MGHQDLNFYMCMICPSYSGICGLKRELLGGVASSRRFVDACGIFILFPCISVICLISVCNTNFLTLFESVMEDGATWGEIFGRE